MNPEISKLFELIELYQSQRLDLDTHNSRKCPMCIQWLEMIEGFKRDIKAISATLNPQIPEPYASMSRDDILERIGQYEQ
ncbi:hypothetical protein [Lactococcus petauri]|uniref:hypothetical protein n=1 Tax=Lactococcus petauri TaxID=1940789 RepID=UPI001F55B22D|nr:hypothetical protein [Lactococcus petauri]